MLCFIILYSRDKKLPDDLKNLKNIMFDIAILIEDIEIDTIYNYIEVPTNEEEYKKLIEIMKTPVAYENPKQAAEEYKKMLSTLLTEPAPEASSETVSAATHAASESASETVSVATQAASSVPAIVPIMPASASEVSQAAGKCKRRRTYKKKYTKKQKLKQKRNRKTRKSLQ